MNGPAAAMATVPSATQLFLDDGRALVNQGQQHARGFLRAPAPAGHTRSTPAAPREGNPHPPNSPTTVTDGWALHEGVGVGGGVGWGGAHPPNSPTTVIWGGAHPPNSPTTVIATVTHTAAPNVIQTPTFAMSRIEK